MVIIFDEPIGRERLQGRSSMIAFGGNVNPFDVI
jgi:hypothetical protein